MTITIYHNPKCSNSRKCLELIREAGHVPKVVPYLDMPLSRDDIAELLKKMKISARDLVRMKEPVFEQLKMQNANDDQLIDAMARHPVLLNRPIVVTEKGAILCRPPERVKDLL